MFVLQYILISLTVTKVSSYLSDSIPDKCYAMLSRTGCKLQKIKWFYNREKGFCFQKLTCSNGFDNRLECERLCFDKQKPQNNNHNVLLLDLYGFITKKSTKKPKKYKTVLPTLSTETTQQSLLTSSVTKELPTPASLTTETTQQSLLTSSVTKELPTPASLTNINLSEELSTINLFEELITTTPLPEEPSKIVINVSYYISIEENVMQATTTDTTCTTSSISLVPSSDNLYTAGTETGKTQKRRTQAQRFWTTSS